MRLNLHMHSNNSDGVFTPTEIVKMQADDNIDACSLTDHDSVAGISESIKAGKKYGVKVIPGIELSSYSICEIHVLGYNFDYLNPKFVNKLDKIKQLRRVRIIKTIERLHELGIPFDDSQINYNAGSIGRVHIATEMVKQGISQSVSDAFYRYLGAGKKAYISGYRLTPVEGVSLIKDFGGVAVLAHPVYIPKDKLELLITGLLPYGLDGLECYYASYNADDTQRFLKLQKKYNLITTSGTDIHNSNLYVSPSYRCDLVDNESLKKLKLI